MMFGASRWLEPKLSGTAIATAATAAMIESLFMMAPSGGSGTALGCGPTLPPDHSKSLQIGPFCGDFAVATGSQLGSREGVEPSPGPAPHPVEVEGVAVLGYQAVP